MATANLPTQGIHYTRNLLNEVKLGKGPGVKALRDVLQQNPRVARRYTADRAVEISNAKQREKMMWVKDCDSHVHRVENDFTDACTYTNPMFTGCVPDRTAVAKSVAKQEFAKLIAPPEMNHRLLS